MTIFPCKANTRRTRPNTMTVLFKRGPIPAQPEETMKNQAFATRAVAGALASSPHIYMEWLKKERGINFLEVR